jgi:hypothetical protein
MTQASNGMCQEYTGRAHPSHKLRFAEVSAFLATDMFVWNRRYSTNRTADLLAHGSVGPDHGRAWHACPVQSPIAFGPFQPRDLIRGDQELD